jgi:hypothetical protein
LYRFYREASSLFATGFVNGKKDQIDTKRSNGCLQTMEKNQQEVELNRGRMLGFSDDGVSIGRAEREVVVPQQRKQ